MHYFIPLGFLWTVLLLPYCRCTDTHVWILQNVIPHHEMINSDQPKLDTPHHSTVWLVDLTSSTCTYIIKLSQIFNNIWDDDELQYFSDMYNWQNYGCIIWAYYSFRTILDVFLLIFSWWVDAFLSLLAQSAALTPKHTIITVSNLKHRKQTVSILLMPFWLTSLTVRYSSCHVISKIFSVAGP